MHAPASDILHHDTYLYSISDFSARYHQKRGFIVPSMVWQSKTLNHGIRALTGGTGVIIILVPGWPQTAEAYTPILPKLMQTHHVFAVDPPGLGESEAPTSRAYDTANISRILHSSMIEEIGEHTPFHLVGHDIGACCLAHRHEDQAGLFYLSSNSICIHL